MNILLIADGVAPLSGTSSASQACGALPKALTSLDHTPFVLTPLYKSVDPKEHNLARRLRKLEVEFAGTAYACELYTGRTIGGSELMFVAHQELFGATDDLRSGANAAAQVGVFLACTQKLMEENREGWDAVHGHGWLGAAAITVAPSELRSVLTIHDGADRPTFAGVAEHFGLTAPFDPVALGLAAASHVATASETTELSKLGFDGEARAVRNGIDGTRWNPVTDPALVARFDPMDFDGKAKCKTALQKDLGFSARARVPLIAILGRAQETREDSGFDLVADTLSATLRNDVQVVVLLEAGNGTTKDALTALSERWPERLQVRESDDTLRHLVIAGSDVLLSPARRGVEAELIMLAQRYGTLPVALRDGVFEEVIVDADASLSTGTGLLFDAADSESLLAATRRAIAAYAKGDAFSRMRSRIMKIDVSWNRSARVYSQMYAAQ